MIQVQTTSEMVFPENIRLALAEIDKAIRMNVLSPFGSPNDTNMGVMMRLFVSRFKAFGFEPKFATGAYRVAFLHKTDGWVIKMPKYRSGASYRDNLVEAFIYQNIDEKYRAYLPETFLWKDSVLVQKRYNNNVDLHHRYWNDIFKIGTEMGLNDLHSGNTGFAEDKSFRIIDFQPSIADRSVNRPIGKLYAQFKQAHP